MTVSYYCKSCKKNNKIKTSANNRFELQQELGDEINNRCKHCGVIEKKHINRLTADPNYIIFYISIFASAILTVLFWNAGFIAKVTLVVPIFLYFDALKKASSFNKTMIKRKIK